MSDITHSLEEASFSQNPLNIYTTAGTSDSGLEADKGNFPGIFSATFQCFTGFTSVFGNILLICVLHDLPNSRLRMTTKLLLSYVSVSHCILSTVAVGRLINMPCLLALLGGYSSGINIIWGIFYLAFEACVMVKKPHNHSKFVSIKICKIQIFLSCFVTMCLNLAMYVTQKDPEDASFCYVTNGALNPWLLFFASVFPIAMIICSTAIQLCTLKALRKTSPIGTQSVPSVSLNLQVLSNPAIHAPSAAQVGSSRMSRLHKLTVILFCSLLCFIICWLPICVCYVTFSLFEILEIDARTKGGVTVSSLVMLNGSLHVAVYVVMSTEIRQALRKYIRSWLCIGTS